MKTLFYMLLAIFLLPFFLVAVILFGVMVFQVIVFSFPLLVVTGFVFSYSWLFTKIIPCEVMLEIREEPHENNETEAR